MTTPLARKIQNMDDLVTAMADMRAMGRGVPSSAFVAMFLTFGELTEENFHHYRDYLRFVRLYWTGITLEVGDVVLQDKTLHVSKSENGTMVAFAENEDKQRRDIFSIMRYGKYLTKYHPELDNEQVKKLVAEFEYDHGEKVEVLFGESEEEFIRAIDEGPSESCMQGMSFDGHIHPAAAYAYGDIKVAWIERDGDITARTLINKATKNFSRVYGDEGRLKPALELLGYAQLPRALAGCRLRKIKNQNGNGYIMPYVDRGIGSGGGALSYRDDGESFYLGEGNGDTADGNEYNGLTQVESDPEYGHCDNCGDPLYYQVDYCYSEHEDHQYCNSCADRYWVYAKTGRRSSDYVSQDAVTYVDCMGEYVLTDALGEFDIVFDSHSGEWIDSDSAVECAYDLEMYYVGDCIEVMQGDDSVYVHETNLDAALSDGKIVDADGVYYAKGYEPEDDEEEGHSDEVSVCPVTTPIMETIIQEVGA